MDESPSIKSQALELYYLMVEVPQLYDARITGALSMIGQQLLRATDGGLFSGLIELQEQFNRLRPVGLDDRQFKEAGEQFLKVAEELRDQFLLMATTEEENGR